MRKGNCPVCDEIRPLFSWACWLAESQAYEWYEMQTCLGCKRSFRALLEVGKRQLDWSDVAWPVVELRRPAG